MIRRRKGLLAAALALATASVLAPVSGTGAQAASGSLRSGNHELVLTTGPTTQSVVVRDVASGASVLAEQQPMQVIVKNGETPTDANGQYASVVLEGTRLVGAGDVRSRNGSVFRFRDSYEAAPGGGFSVTRTVAVVTANAADQGFNSRFTIGAAAPRPLQDYQFLAPGVMYDRNRTVPAGALGSNLNDNYLYFREMRMPLPFVMMHDPGSGLDVSLAHQNPRAASPVDEGSGAWLVNGGITHAALGAQRVPSSKLAIVYPGMEGEKNYVNRGAAWVRRSNPVTVGHTQSYQFRIRAHKTADFGAAVRDSWRYHWDMSNPEITKVPVQQVYRSSVDVLASYQGNWGGAPGLPFSVWMDGNVREVSYQMGFVGQQIPAAYLMLRDGLLNNRPDHATKGRQILDFWAANSSAPSGLPRTWYDVNPPGWRSFYPTYLRIATDGLEGVLKAARFMRGRGTPVASWESYARRFGDWLVANQNADGSYYRSYNLAGTAPDNQAKYNTHNAIPFLMELTAYTGDTRYRTAALRAAEFAWQTVHLPSAYVGGTPDNPNVTDKEAASLALRAFLSAYDHTRDQRWLQAAQRAADFAETWQFAWNYSVASSRPAYAKYGVRGQSVIATGHSAMDTWQSGMLFDFYRLYRATNDNHYLQQARLLANNTKLTTQYPGNPLGYGRDGLVEEAIGLADLRYGGVDLWLPWNSVAHAESLAMLQDTYGNMDIDVLSGNPVPDPTVKRIRNQHSNLCLDDYNAVTTPGAEVRQWTCNGLPVQDWTLTPVGDGYYEVRNGHSDLCLDNKDFATAPGAVVHQWTCNNLPVQHWRLTTTSGVTTLVNRHSGLCLDNYNWGTAPGAEVRQWTCNGLTAQDWSIA
ncbi:hypothetical protein F4560_002709 [Saccharothrix ecbatanensis]|uniref:Ricin B lectin domain-containing protein n=1 Tax=Saccharothrix ecbatanensis TaxID=1105145 RepID=A0A7W9HJ34_9PSEU|nr:RICIN domain-containing protein [Saccharothrix ecbatanensis]MBB5802941.1 hypothetical protein [Saccharothrix ecbatanensis]